MLDDTQLPRTLWEEVLSTACYMYMYMYIQNRSPTKAAKGKTPYEALYGEKPVVGHLCMFG